MTNCCNQMTGACEQGKDCPARETPHDKAVMRFWDASTPGYYEMLDAPGNFWDRRGIVGKAAIVFVAWLACSLAAGVVVGVMT